jgi:hypothetical protein
MRTTAPREREVAGHPPASRSLAPVVLSLLLLAASGAQANPGGGPTGCVHLCPAVWTNYVLYGTIANCVVGIGVSSTPPYNRDVAVIPGSTIDCGPLEVHVTQYDLTVTEGGFLLLGKRVLVSGSGNRIAGLCSTVYDKHGFRLVTTNGIDVTSGGELTTTCQQGGGYMELRTDTNVTLGGSALTANAQYGPGGEVVIRADGNITVTSAIEARNTSTSGYYEGGGIVLDGKDVTIQASLSATGTNKPGGRIHVDASGNLTVNTGGTIDASGAQSDADGGEIKLEANGTLVTSRPIKAQGAGATSYGGAISIVGSAVDVDNDVKANGGKSGGSIEVESRGGALRIANAASAPITLDVTRSSNNAGDGGDLSVRSRGGDVSLTSYADLNASGAGSGSAGSIEVAGVGITAATSSSIRADSSASGEGGDVIIRARGPLTLSGAVTATNGGYVTILHRDANPSTGGVTCPSSTCDLTRDQWMPAPCGDGIKRAGVEQCDGPDLGGATCQSIGGFSGGTLACSSTCTFNTSGCTP